MITAWYASVYAQMERIAWRHGYALALHGSMSRDLDVVAIPWTADAADSERLLMAFIRAVYKGQDKAWRHKRVAEKKPHGRLAYVLHLGASGDYMDVSIMPRITRARKRKEAGK